MLNVFRFMFVCILLSEFVVANLNIRFKGAKRNASFDNIYKTDNVLLTLETKSIFNCIASCSDHIDCRSVAYNLNDGRCQVFNREFTNQIVAGTTEAGWRHFDVSKGVDCRDGPTTARDCADIQSQGYTCSGVYNINISSQITVNVWCDLHTDGGRWTVFQHRKDGSVDFEMNWSDYKHGFGDPYTEYWIGNDNLYTLTKSGRTELLILMGTWDGVWKHASYSEFYISDESDNYRLGLSGFSGTAGDSLMDKTSPQAGNQFSTRDRDNDKFSGSCNPSFHVGGFWFNRCGRSDLNGYYYRSAVQATDSCNWNTFLGKRESLKTIYMMVRKV